MIRWLRTSAYRPSPVPGAVQMIHRHHPHLMPKTVEDHYHLMLANGCKIKNLPSVAQPPSADEGARRHALCPSSSLDCVLAKQQVPVAAAHEQTFGHVFTFESI